MNIVKLKCINMHCLKLLSGKFDSYKVSKKNVVRCSGELALVYIR